MMKDEMCETNESFFFEMRARSLARLLALIEASDCLIETSELASTLSKKFSEKMLMYKSRNVDV
jgi:hypothetical protein